MKKLLLLLALLSTPSFAARYFVNGGVDSLYGTSGNWSASDGGAGGAGVPTSSDDVFFTVNSPNCTVSSARVGKTLDFTGYTNTITLNGTLTISGSVTLATGMTSAGSSALIVNATSTLTSNGKTWVPPLTLSGAITFTLADNWAVTGLLTLGSTSNATVVNGNQITGSGGLTIAATTGTVSGTTEIITAGTGTVTGPSSNGSFRNPFTVGGTITFAAGDFRYNSNTMTCTGTITATSANLVSGIAAATTFDCSSATWATISLIGATTFTLSSDLTCTGVLTLGVTSSTVTVNGSHINVGGGLTMNNTTSATGGTTEIHLTGTGHMTAASLTTGHVGLPINIDAGGGTITVDTVFTIDLGLVKFTSGTVIAGNTWATGGSAAKPLGIVRVQ